ncbi:hypothetical protein THZG08_550003 [Vibrio owensii]|nr:hypothetical protein THZG08_550003 [Vibrio owensii]CAH1585472.1 hypothetical protein THOA03_550003 [Vibrio owensii]
MSRFKDAYVFSLTTPLKAVTIYIHGKRTDLIQTDSETIYANPPLAAESIRAAQ